MGYDGVMVEVILLLNPYPPVLSPLGSFLTCGERKLLSPLSASELASAEGRGYLGRGREETKEQRI